MFFSKIPMMKDVCKKPNNKTIKKNIIPSSKIPNPDSLGVRKPVLGTLLYIILPTVVAVLAFCIFVSEIHFLQRNARRKRVRYTLYWILGTYPMGITCHLIALYIPRSGKRLKISLFY